jgi:hypothetical protein
MLQGVPPRGSEVTTLGEGDIVMHHRFGIIAFRFVRPGNIILGWSDYTFLSRY